MAYDVTGGDVSESEARDDLPPVPRGPAGRPVMTAPTPYHRLFRTPGFQWWQAVFGTLIILCGWMVATIVALLPAQALHPDPPGVVSWAKLLATNVSLAALVPLSIVVVVLLHRIPAGYLSSVQPGLRWRLLGLFAGIAVLAELAMLVAAGFLPVDLGGEVGGPAKDAGAVIAVTLLTSTFQAAGEEYFFRGYLMQALGAAFRWPWVSVVLTAVLFTLAHGIMPWQSPALFLDRFVFGLVAGWLVVRTGGLEAGIAMHAANNVVTFVFAALTNSVSDSLEATDAPWPVVALDVAKFVLFGVVAAWLARRREVRTTADRPG